MISKRELRKLDDKSLVDALRVLQSAMNAAIAYLPFAEESTYEAATEKLRLLKKIEELTQEAVLYASEQARRLRPPTIVALAQQALAALYGQKYDQVLVLQTLIKSKSRQLKRSKNATAVMSEFTLFARQKAIDLLREAKYAARCGEIPRAQEFLKLAMALNADFEKDPDVQVLEALMREERQAQATLTNAVQEIAKLNFVEGLRLIRLVKETLGRHQLKMFSALVENYEWWMPSFISQFDAEARIAIGKGEIGKAKEYLDIMLEIAPADSMTVTLSRIMHPTKDAV